MERHILDVVVFSEVIRDKMKLNTPTLIRHRRPYLFRGYQDVFAGNEAVTWAMKTLRTLDEDTDKKNNNSSDETTTNERSNYLNETQVCCLYQKLMDAGLLQNVINQEEFRNDKSLFRFTTDDLEAEKIVRAVAIGYRLFKSASQPTSKLFQRVCALGQLVSCECLQSADIVSWLVENRLCNTRELAVELARAMTEFNILKPVDSDIEEFTDGSSFYIFAADYSQPPPTVQQFLSSSVVRNKNSQSPPEIDSNNKSRNKLIHLRQTSDKLMDLSHLSLQASNQRSSRHKAVSTSSDDSGFNDNSSISPPSYQSLLKSDGTMTKAALLHPAAPFVKKNLWVYPDAVGYGFVIRGSGPCFVKIVDPDSPAGKAGLKASQYITEINGINVVELPHTGIEDLILTGPKHLKISIMQHKDQENNQKTVQQPVTSSVTKTPVRQRSSPPLPSAQPWIKKRGSATYGNGFQRPAMRQVVTQ